MSRFTIAAVFKSATVRFCTPLSFDRVTREANANAWAGMAILLASGFLVTAPSAESLGADVDKADWAVISDYDPAGDSNAKIPSAEAATAALMAHEEYDLGEQFKNRLLQIARSREASPTAPSISVIPEQRVIMPVEIAGPAITVTDAPKLSESIDLQPKPKFSDAIDAATASILAATYEVEQPADAVWAVESESDEISPEVVTPSKECQSCRSIFQSGVGQVPPISTLNIVIQAPEATRNLGVPANQAVERLGSFEQGYQVYTGCVRNEFQRGFYWEAASFHHQPLYFEQPQVERYGHFVCGDCVQSVVSTAHFFGSIPLLPYKLGAEPPRSCDYTLGRGRPGDCNPRAMTCKPLSGRGLIYQGMATTGAVFIVP